MTKNKVIPAKKTHEAIATEHILSDNQAGDDDIDEEETQNNKFAAALASSTKSSFKFLSRSARKVFTSAFRQFEEKTTRSSHPRSTTFLTQRKAAYAESRKNAKVVTQTCADIIESIRGQLEDSRSQEQGFQNHREDCSLPFLSQKKALQDVDDLYSPLLKELGPLRSAQVNEANRMLRNNDDCRQYAVDQASRKARYQLELTRQMEQDAVDAKELIDHTKNLLRVKPVRRQVRGKRMD